MSTITVASVAERLQASALNVDLWEDSLDYITKCLDVAGVVLFSTDSHFARPICSRRMASSTDDYMQNGWHLRDERYRGVPKLLESGLITDDDIATEKQRGASPYYQDFLKRHGIGLFAGVGFKAGDDLWAMSIQRNVGEGGFDARQLDPIRKLWRPLSDAASLSRQLSFSRVLGITDAYEQMRQPAIVLDADLRVLTCNQRAHPLNGRLFATFRHRIKFLDVRNDKVFELLVRRLRADALPVCSPAAIQIADGQGGKIPLRLIELTGWSRHAFTNARYILLIGSIEYDPEKIEADLRRQFSLTSAEARIGYALMSGRSLAKIASEAGISYETARTHCRTIFAKIGVRRQAELAAVLWKSLTG